jgi:lycopene cyclase domain-containing protein
MQFSNFFYLLFNIVIFIPVFIFAYIFKPNFLEKKLVRSISLVAVFFIIWDVAATYLGHWSFSPKYTLGINLINLPIEEVLFFVTVPFSSLFMLYLTIEKFKNKKVSPYFDKVFLTTASLSCFFLFGNSFGEKQYTTIASSLSLGCLYWLTRYMQRQQKYFYTWLFVMFCLFFIFNLFLTWLPVVEYGPGNIIGFRVISIPIEDFLFNFVLMCGLAAVYKKNTASIN